jgi:transcriptional regulator with XRE-family HTH domain
MWLLIHKFKYQNTNLNEQIFLVWNLQFYILILTFYNSKFSLNLLWIPFFCFTFVNRNENGLFAPIINYVREMKDRIRQIMESKHMTQQVFAQFIEMSPASLSSIFNDRTKPTLNIVEAIKKKIPNINTDWLMFGSGEMYVSPERTQDQAQTPVQTTENGLFDSVSPVLDFDTSLAPTPQTATPSTGFSNSVKSTHRNFYQEEVKTIDKPQRKVVEIRVFYDDQTWESFSPMKK